MTETSPDLSWPVLFELLKKKEQLGSDAQLARDLGVSRGFICSIKKGKRNMPVDRGLAVLRRLGIRPNKNDLALLLAGSKVRKVLK
ncbi:MAG: hypothetical protein RLO04_11300 [Limnobacter sp.]|jgi:hypothetical protein|uniref:hypothetical protein n=1 Tax=unclassified Limnobacter TaxID=2630203 RepID=UPI00135B8FDD|nr:hypothetical protein [Limnobacter sp. 130]